MNNAETDDLLHVTLASIGDAVIATDPDGRVTFLNAVAETLTGWPTEEARGLPLATVFRILNEHSREPVENPVEKVLRLGQIVGMANHTVLIAKDGAEVPIDDSAAPIRGRDGRLRGVVLVFRDITDRKLAEASAAERHRITALRADIGTVLAKSQPLQAGLQTCCEAFVRHLDMAFARVWTLEEAANVLELVASAGLYTHLDGSHSRVKVGEFKIGRIAETRRPHLTNDVPHDPNVSDQAWAKQEGMVAFAGYPLVLDGQVLGVMAMFSRRTLSTALLDDLAPLADQLAQHVERKRAEERVRESELRYRLIGQAANDAIWDWDLVTNRVVWNEGVQARFGYQPEQIGDDASWWIEHIHEADRQRISHGIHTVIDGGEFWQEEYRFRRADGTYATVFDRGRVVQDENGRPTRMVGSMLDMTERKRLEAQLRQFFSMAEKSRDFIGMAGLDQTPFFLNEAGRRMVGLAPEQMSQVKVLDFFFPEDRARVRDEIVPAVMRDGHAEEEIRFRNFTTGEAVWVIWSVFQLFDSDGILTGLATVSRDITERRRSEETLRESEQRRRLALDSAELGTWSVDPVTMTLLADERFQAMFGVKERRLNYEQAFAAIHPDDRQRVRDAAAAATRPDDPASYAEEYRVIHPDGSIRWVSAKGRANFESNGAERRLISFDGTVLDVTERKRVEESLRYQLDLTRSITDNATTAIFMMDDKSRCTFMNPAAEAMTGFSFTEVNGGILHDFIHHHRPDGTLYPMPECPLDRALPEHFEVRNHEDVFFRKNGEAFPVTCNARVTYKEGAAVGTVIEVRDTTADRIAAEATRKRSEQLRKLAEVATRIGVAHDVASVMGIVTEEIRNVIDAHQSVASMTVDQDWAQAITAVSISEKYDRWKDYSSPPDGSGIYSLVCRLNRPMRLTQAELESHPAWKRFGGDEKHPPMRGWLAARLVGRDGRNIGLIQVSDKSDGDFTEDDEAMLVQLAQMASVAVENARLVESLRHADRRKDEFLATLAHELRNPLAPIRMGLEVMKLGAQGPREMEEIRTMMERQTQQLITLVDDLLDVSRITQGKFELRKCRVTLSDVVRSAVEASRPLIDESGHQLTVAVPDRAIHLEADPNRLAQVISNLLNNAAKYTPEGGQIWLSVERQGSDVLVSIRDNGIGIPAEMQRRVFEMFAQIDRPMEKGYVGLGIGLTLVRSLVEMHGGVIDVRSEGTGKGSEFTVRLPILVEQHAEERKAEPSQTGSAKVKRRVLIVDDNKAAADMLGMVVRMLGNEVRTAGDGQEALNVAAEYLPDVVLMDIGMPKLNGYEAARRIREQPWGETMLLIALTGWGQEEDRQRTRDAGFDHHLVKPAEPAALQKLLADLKPSKS